MDTNQINQLLKSVRVYSLKIPEEIHIDCDAWIKGFLYGCKIPGIIIPHIVKALQGLDHEQRRRLIAGVLISGRSTYLNVNRNEIDLLREFVVREIDLVPFRTYDYQIKPFPIEGRYHYVKAPIFEFIWTGELGEWRTAKYVCCLRVFRIRSDPRTIRPDEEILRQDVEAHQLDERGFDGLYLSARVAYEAWREELEHDIRRKSEENMRSRLTRRTW